MAGDGSATATLSLNLVEGSVIWVEGVALAPAVGACRMWKEEEMLEREKEATKGVGENPSFPHYI